MRLAVIATSCALLAACFSRPTFNPDGSGDAGLDAPLDGPSIDPAAPAMIATGGGGGGTGGHACRIKDGMLLCWGSNSNGQLSRASVTAPVDFTGTPGVASFQDGWTSVATGVQHTCGVRSGAVYCWGSNLFGQSAPDRGSASSLIMSQVTLPVTDAVERVFAGGFMSCAITISGETYCWGDIDLQRTKGPMVPARLGAPGTRFAQVALADDHACARASDGVVHCWGEAEEQQTGQGDEADLTFAQARPITGSNQFTSLSAGHEATCGTTTTGELICWGSVNHGQLGDTSSSSNGSVPLRIGTDTGWTAVAVGARHTCGVRAGDVYCFGDDQYGALGGGTFNASRALPTIKVATGMTVSQIAASDGYTCALSGDAVTMKCWGTNAKGELGNKEYSRKLDPAAVSFGERAHQIVTGDNHTCALVGPTLPAPAYCWGQNSEQEVGASSGEPLLSEPTQAAGAMLFQQIAAGGLHTCGITNDDSTILCWGDNVSHQLGSMNGDNIVPVVVPAGAGVRWISVAAGSRMSCAITNLNKLFCWGLRPGIAQATGTPTEYAPPTGTWKSISIGSDFAVGVVNDQGQARMYSIAQAMTECAANLPSGQVNPQIPHEILAGFAPWGMGFPTVAAAQHSGAHTCMLRAVGGLAAPVLTCLGASSAGQTGGSVLCTPPGTTDVAPPGTSTWLPPTPANQTLFTADDHSCALDAISELYCWGQNSNFELGRVTSGPTPRRVNTKTWMSIAGSFQHTCGIDSAGAVFCWGENQYGQVGDGTSYEPSPVISGVP